MILLRLAIPTPLRQLFDYLPPEGFDCSCLQPGTRVRVPFGRREVVGVLLAVVSTTTVPLAKLKPAIAILDQKPILDPSLLELMTFAADYYHHPFGEVIVGVLPRRLRQGKECPEFVVESSFSIQPSYELTSEQQSAVATIKAQRDFSVFLLAGVTGSGKTEVYLQAMADCLSRQKQVLMLVPEIGLTPQTLQRIQQRFQAEVVMLHSNLNDTEKLTAWAKAAAGQAKIILGTRSALFTPIPNLGLIVVDEEHDMSYKQAAGFRYHARDLAIKRASITNVPIVLGSATPSLSSLANVKAKRFQLLPLTSRVGEAELPKVSLMNLRSQRLTAGLGQGLMQKIREHLQAGSQVLLFLNRRGYAPVLMCHHCGWVAECQRCDTKLTLHQKPLRLCCHHCESRQPVLKHCPDCKQTELMPVGQGTEQLEDVLQQEFADYTCLRIDRDSTQRKNSLQEHMAAINSNEAQLLIGTQMLAKGHHFPNLTLVAVVDVDSGLLCADFRALEYMAQLLVLVSGRAGRANKVGEVVLQTHYPEHPLLKVLLSKGYMAFAELLLEEREQLALPPYTYQAVIRAEAVAKETPIDFLQIIKQRLGKADDVAMYGPLPLTIARKAGRFRQQLILQAGQRQCLHRQLNALINIIAGQKQTRKVRWSVDVDPVE